MSTGIPDNGTGGGLIVTPHNGDAPPPPPVAEADRASDHHGHGSDGLLKLAALSPGEREAMGQRGRAFAMAHHAYPVLAARFIDALRS